MFAKIKKFAWVIVRFIQKITVFVSLFIIYVLGLGITKLFFLASGNGASGRNREKDETAWIEAAGYEADTEVCQKQS